MGLFTWGHSLFKSGTLMITLLSTLKERVLI
jgi:hypothetical protein